MITLEKITRSHIPTKKFDANLIVDGRKKVVPFGAVGYTDYTLSKDPKTKERYLTRHKRREDWTNPLTAGFWSRWYLWNLPSRDASETQLRAKFDL